MDNGKMYEQSGLVYDPEHGTWDKVEASKSSKDKGPGHPRLRKTLRNVGILALAGGLSYGAVHTAAEFSGTKAGSFGTHDVSVPSLWNDFIGDVQARIEKGF